MNEPKRRTIKSCKSEGQLRKAEAPRSAAMLTKNNAVQWKQRHYGDTSAGRYEAGCDARRCRGRAEPSSAVETDDALARLAIWQNLAAVERRKRSSTVPAVSPR